MHCLTYTNPLCAGPLEGGGGDCCCGTTAISLVTTDVLSSCPLSNGPSCLSCDPFLPPLADVGLSGSLI